MKHPKEMTNEELLTYLQAHTDWYEEYVLHDIDTDEEAQEVMDEVNILREVARRLNPKGN